jgi:hypothetical protein
MPENNDILAEADALIAHAEAALVYPIPNVTMTDRILAYYAMMPITDLSVRYLVQIREPVQMATEKYSIPFSDVFEFAISHASTMFKSPEDALKEHILLKYRENFANVSDEDLRGPDVARLFKIDKVELVECDLLVPRQLSGVSGTLTSSKK